MYFSVKFKHSSPKLCKISPNGAHVANANKSKLIIRDIGTLQTQASFNSLHVIEQIEWSSDSLFVACTSAKKGIVQV